MRQKLSEEEKLYRIIDDLAEDIFSSSEEEVSEEAMELFDDPGNFVSKMRSNASSLILESRKQKLIEARNAVAESNQIRNTQRKEQKGEFSPNELWEEIKNMLRTKPSLSHPLLACRDEKDLSVNDLESILQDLKELSENE